MLASVHLLNDSPNHAHWLMRRLVAESGPTPTTARDWGVAFPYQYMEMAHRFGARYDLSPFLVQAVIRQESGFRPTVKSWAGAMGLMQLMPGTARYVSKAYGEKKKVRKKHLRVPETNVRLGTMYLRLHTAHTVDRIPLALAGYNAGPAPLRSWMDRFGDRELDAWVESITYQEARGYVRKVMTSYITYSALYGGRLVDIELAMPSDLRPWGEVPRFSGDAPSQVSQLFQN
jgi:soluble lytic murein transglycosylase